MGARGHRICTGFGVLGLAPAAAAPAFAHASERGQVLLLPTGYYIAGGAAAVFASTLLVALLPDRAVSGRSRWRRLPMPGWTGDMASLISLAVFILVLAAGFAGPPDPIGNLLPGFVWGIFWLGLSVVSLLAGDLWPVLNPWSGLLRLAGVDRALIAYPKWLSHWPAAAQFLFFAWVELVDPSPADPAHLLRLSVIYTVANGAGALLFSPDVWLKYAEPFSAYFRMLGKLSPVAWRSERGGPSVRLRWPGQGLLDAPLAPLSEAAFIVLALATVSFDGLSHTFAWVGYLGLNPLEYPGRSAVIAANSLGLAAMALVLGVAFAASVLGVPSKARSGLVWAIVPIAVAYHLAHYLPDAPLILMHAFHALGDSLGRLDILNLSNIEPPASLVMNQQAAHWFYRAQTALIVAGHVAAVVVGHLRLTQLRLTPWRTFAAEFPLNLLMIGYTVFGLWLLSTAVIG